MICRICGKDNKEGGKFCVYCGNKLQEEQLRFEQSKKVETKTLKDAICDCFKKSKFIFFVIITSILTVAYIAAPIALIGLKLGGAYLGIVLLICFLPFGITGAITVFNGWKILIGKKIEKDSIKKLGLLGLCQKIMGAISMIGIGIWSAYRVFFEMTERDQLMNIVWVGILSFLVPFIHFTTGRMISKSFDNMSDSYSRGVNMLDERGFDIILWASCVLCVAPCAVLFMLFGMRVLSVSWILLALGGYYASVAMFFKESGDYVYSFEKKEADKVDRDYHKNW